MILQWSGNWKERWTDVINSRIVGCWTSLMSNGLSARFGALQIRNQVRGQGRTDSERQWKRRRGEVKKEKDEAERMGGGGKGPMGWAIEGEVSCCELGRGGGDETSLASASLIIKLNRLAPGRKRGSLQYYQGSRATNPLSLS